MRLFFEYGSFSDNLIILKCLSCNKSYSKKIDEESKEWFRNIFKFHKNDIDRFILLLRKCVCSYEFMGNGEKPNETLPLEKQEFNCNVNMKDIIDSDYNQRKEICKNFETKHLDEYYDLYLKFMLYTLLLADFLDHFRKLWLEIY